MCFSEAKVSNYIIKTICIAHYKQKSLGAGVSVNETNKSLTPGGTAEG